MLSLNRLKINERISIHMNNHKISLKDFLNEPDTKEILTINFSRFKCIKCNNTENDDISIKEPNTFITNRCANWIRKLLSKNITVNHIKDITGVHWNTSLVF